MIISVKDFIWRILRLDIIESPLQRYIVGVIYVIDFLALLISCAYTIATFNLHLATALIEAVGFVIALFLFVMTWRGAYLTVGKLHPLFYFGVVALLVVFNDGVYDEALFLLPTIIILAGLLIGRRGIVIYTVLGILLTVGVGLTAQSGFTVPFSSSMEIPVPDSRIVLLSILLGLVGASSYVVVDNMLISQKEQGRIRADLQLRNEDLENLKNELEERVQERSLHAEQAAREAGVALRQAEAASQALAQQAQLAHAEIQLSEALIGELGILDLANRSIHRICQSTDAQAGAFFVWDGEFLVLAGRYALDNVDDPRRFRLGEGLIGQAALEKHSLYLEIPEEKDLVIQFGIGQMPPRYEIVEPVLYQNELYGVLAIGLLEEPRKLVRQFMARAANVIGGAIQSAQARERINTLLLRTQLMAEDLRNQEQELRATNHALQTQAEKTRLRR